VNFLRVLFILAAAVGIATAGTVSYTGTLPTAESTEDFTVTLASAGIVTLQTYSFGGGTNAAGTNIAAGGMASFLAVFNGTGDSATFVNGTSFDQTNYSSFEGCPPAGAPTIGGSPVCGDITMSLS